MTTTLAPDEVAAPAAEPPRRRRRLPLPVRFVVFAVLAVGVLVGFLWLLSWQSPVPVRAVTVTGAAPEKQDELLAAAGIPTGTAIRDIDRAAVTERVGAVPGIESVDLVLERPFTIALAVVERVPFAVTQTAGGWTVLDQHGDPISEGPDRPAGLAHVTGADPHPAVAALAALSPELRTDVQETTVAESGEVTLRLADGVTVLWGRAGEEALKGQVVGQLLRYRPKTINVAVPQRPALTGDLDLPKQNRLATPTPIP